MYLLLVKFPLCIKKKTTHTHTQSVLKLLTKSVLRLAKFSNNPAGGKTQMWESRNWNNTELIFQVELHVSAPRCTEPSTYRPTTCTTINQHYEHTTASSQLLCDAVYPAISTVPLLLSILSSIAVPILPACFQRLTLTHFAHSSSLRGHHRLSSNNRTTPLHKTIFV